MGLSQSIGDRACLTSIIEQKSRPPPFRREAGGVGTLRPGGLNKSSHLKFRLAIAIALVEPDAPIEVKSWFELFGPRSVGQRRLRELRIV